MSHQSQYHAYLQDLRADAACEQLLENPNFINWYAASDTKRLVILGDMGCGKTVAMSYLVDMMRERIRRRLPEHSLGTDPIASGAAPRLKKAFFRVV